MKMFEMHTQMATELVLSHTRDPKSHYWCEQNRFMKINKEIAI